MSSSSVTNKMRKRDILRMWSQIVQREGIKKYTSDEWQEIYDSFIKHMRKPKEPYILIENIDHLLPDKLRQPKSQLQPKFEQPEKSDSEEEDESVPLATWRKRIKLISEESATTDIEDNVSNNSQSNTDDKSDVQSVPSAALAAVAQPPAVVAAPRRGRPPLVRTNRISLNTNQQNPRIHGLIGEKIKGKQNKLEPRQETQFIQQSNQNQQEHPQQHQQQQKLVQTRSINNKKNNGNVLQMEKRYQSKREQNNSITKSNASNRQYQRKAGKSACGFVEYLPPNHFLLLPHIYGQNEQAHRPTAALDLTTQSATQTACSSESPLTLTDNPEDLSLTPDENSNIYINDTTEDNINCFFEAHESAAAIGNSYKNFQDILIGGDGLSFEADDRLSFESDENAAAQKSTNNLEDIIDEHRLSFDGDESAAAVKPENKLEDIFIDEDKLSYSFSQFLCDDDDVMNDTAAIDTDGVVEIDNCLDSLIDKSLQEIDTTDIADTSNFFDNLTTLPLEMCKTPLELDAMVHNVLNYEIDDDAISVATSWDGDDDYVTESSADKMDDIKEELNVNGTIRNLEKQGELQLEIEQDNKARNGYEEDKEEKGQKTLAETVVKKTIGDLRSYRIPLKTNSKIQELPDKPDEQQQRYLQGMKPSQMKKSSLELESSPHNRCLNENPFKVLVGQKSRVRATEPPSPIFAPPYRKPSKEVHPSSAKPPHRLLAEPLHLSSAKPRRRLPADVVHLLPVKSPDRRPAKEVHPSSAKPPHLSSAKPPHRLLAEPPRRLPADAVHLLPGMPTYSLPAEAAHVSSAKPPHLSSAKPPQRLPGEAAHLSSAKPTYSLAADAADHLPAEAAHLLPANPPNSLAADAADHLPAEAAHLLPANPPNSLPVNSSFNNVCKYSAPARQKYAVFGIKCFRFLGDSCHKLDCNHTLNTIGEVMRQLYKMKPKEIRESYKQMMSSQLLFKCYLLAFAEIFGKRGMITDLAITVQDCALYKASVAPMVMDLYNLLVQYKMTPESAASTFMEHLWSTNDAAKYESLTTQLLRILATADWYNYIVVLEQLFYYDRFPIPVEFLKSIAMDAVAKQQQHLIDKAIQLMIFYPIGRNTDNIRSVFEILNNWQKASESGINQQPHQPQPQAHQPQPQAHQPQPQAHQPQPQAHQPQPQARQPQPQPQPQVHNQQTLQQKLQQQERNAMQLANSGRTWYQSYDEFVNQKNGTNASMPQI